MNGGKMTKRRMLVVVPLFLFIFVLVSPVVCKESESGERKMSYKGYQVLRLTADDHLALSTLLAPLEKQSIVDVWARYSKSADVIVAPEYIPYVTQSSANLNIRTDVIVADLQSRLQEDFRQRQQGPQKRSRSLPDITSRYLSYGEMQNYLQQVLWADKGTSVTVGSIGKSYENRDVSVIEIREKWSSGRKKPVILIDAGIHAREWIAPAMALNIIKKLALHGEDDWEERQLLQMFDWSIVPCVNPDGYVYSQARDENRLWRKTRTRAYSDRCYGVDGNRNFQYDWDPDKGGSRNACFDTYAGPKFFSEPETRNVRDWMHRYADRAVAYITMHSFGEYVLYPYGSDYRKRVDNESLMYTLGRTFSNELRKTGHDYEVGNAAFLLYVAAGGSDDYAKGSVNITVSYTLELSPKYISDGGFDLPEDRIQGVVEDTWPGFKALVKELYKETASAGTRQEDANNYSHNYSVDIPGQGRVYFDPSVLAYLQKYCQRPENALFMWCRSVVRSVFSDSG